MGEKDWEKIEEIVDVSLTLSGDNRTTYIQQRCAADSGLKNQVEALIKSIESSEGFLEDPIEVKTTFLHYLTSKNKSDKPSLELLGTEIGKYRLDDVLGHGGMGSVYLASRADGNFDQIVALKVIRRDVLNPDLRKRFTKEQRILAGLNHDSIARLYDGGVTHDGLPYLIMEFVEGVSIDKYCDQKKLTVKSRIELLKSVFDAVQYAHNNLIIHRDLKPENILVTKTGKIKILDFGIATLQNAESSNNSTDNLRDYLTLKSAAPEQVSGLGVTTETDVYSLGLLLYRLITGFHPLEFSEKSTAEAISIIETKTVTPGYIRYSKLPAKIKSSVAKNRSTTPAKLEQQLKGDLEVILQKALHLKKESRYSSIDQMWSDLQRYLSIKPLLSQQDNHPLRLKKFFKRNRVLITVAGVLLTAFSSIVIYYSGQVKKERDFAIYQAEKAEEVTAFLLELFEANDPAYAQGEEITALTMLDRGLERADNIENYQLRTSMLATIGDALTRLSEFDKAATVLEQALDLSIITFGELSVETASVLHSIGKNYSDNHNWHLALPFYENSHEIYSSILSSDDPRVARSLSSMGVTLANLGEIDTALEYSERAYLIIRGNHSYNHPDLFNAMNEYAYVLSATDQEKAEEIYHDVISKLMESGRQLDYRLASPYNNLGMLYRNMEKYELSEEYYKKALEVSKLTMGDDHRFTRMVHINLLTPLFNLGKHDEAEEILKKNIEINKNRYSEFHWRVGSAYGAYGVYMINIGDYEKANSLFQKQSALYGDQLGEDHIWTSYSIGALAATYYFLNEIDFAESLYNRHIVIYEERYPNFNNDHKSQLRRLINMYSKSEESFSDVIERYKALLN
jgi:eukaryotic-like serine/threonine-protein kinase